MTETNNSRRQHRLPHKTAIARGMRQNLTKAELALWCILRGSRLGVRFRRQQPISAYIVDFYCSAAKLVVELDGSQHGEKQRQVQDQVRTHWLESEGFEVLRFWNAEFFEDRDSVVEAIARAVRRRTPQLRP